MIQYPSFTRQPVGLMPTGLHRSSSLATFLMRVCVLLVLLALGACGDVTNLQSGLNDADANEIITVLNRHGIKTEKRISKDGVTVAVSASEISRATELMHAAGLPKRARSNLGQVFKKEGMISTPLEERVRYIHGLSQELEFTLQQFDNVVSARVHVVLPERIAPGEPVQPSSAAVFIKYRPPLDEDMVIPRVRSLVASSIPGLSGEEGYGKVSVVLAPGINTESLIEWASIGPFRVHASSTGALIGTLALLVALAIAGLAFSVAIIAKPDMKFAVFLRKYIGAAPAFKAPVAAKEAAR